MSFSPAPSLSIATASLHSLKTFFDGHVVATGYFMSRFRKIKRGISILMRGSWENERLTLDQDIAFHDGARERKTWRYRRIAASVYEGTREDVSGTAIIYPNGDVLCRDYIGRMRTGTFRGMKARFRDVIAAEPDGTVAVHGVVSKWGIRLGTITLRLVHVAAPQIDRDQLAAATA